MRSASPLRAWLRKSFLNPLLKPLVAHRREMARKRRDRMQEKRLRLFYADFIKAGDLAFDVGAHCGNRTRVFLDLGARVVAVEPQKPCAAMLLASYQENPNFHLVPKALGGAEGRAELTICNGNGGASSLSPGFIASYRGGVGRLHESMWQDKKTVEVTTLDALIGRYGVPDFLKIDVEGYEAEVLRGLSRKVRALSFEFHPHFLEPALKSIEMLSRFGPMRLNYIYGESFRWMLKEWTTPEGMTDLLGKSREHPHCSYGDVYVRFGA